MWGIVNWNIVNRASRLLVVAALLAVPGLGAAQTLPRGTVIDDVKCESEPAQSYALYLPSTYSADRKWNLLHGLELDDVGDFLWFNRRELRKSSERRMAGHAHHQVLALEGLLADELSQPQPHHFILIEIRSGEDFQVPPIWSHRARNDGPPPQSGSSALHAAPLANARFPFRTSDSARFAPCRPSGVNSSPFCAL